MTKFFVALILSAGLLTEASLSAEPIKINASANSKITNQTIAKATEEAVELAIHQGLIMGVKRFLDETTVLKNESLLKKIFSLTRGKILLGYSIDSKEVQNRAVHLQLTLQVDAEALRSVLTTYGLIHGEQARPKVVFLIAAKSLSSERIEFAWAEGKKDLGKLPPVQEKVEAHFRDANQYVISPQTCPLDWSHIRTLSLNADRVAQIMDACNADVLVIARINENRRREMITFDLNGSFYSRTEVSSQTNVKTSVKGLVYESALSEFLNAFYSQLIPLMNRNLNQALEPSPSLTIHVIGIQKYAQIEKIINHLKNNSKMVRQASLRAVTGNEYIFAVVLNASVKDFIERNRAMPIDTVKFILTEQKKEKLVYRLQP
jgi:hypothetical protein